MLSIITRLKLFFATEIFLEDATVNALAKFVVADIISGASDAAVDSAVNNFQSSNPIFPFCAYGYDFTEKIGTRDSHLQRSGKYYDSTLGTYVSSKTVKNSIPFIFFFNNPKDYFAAQKLVQTIIASPTKLDVPIIVGSTTYSFSIILNIDVEKGTYSGAFVEHMRVGNIFDINLNCSIEYNDLTFDNTNIYPVDDMIATLYQMNDEDDSLNVQTGQAYAPSTPAITSSIPLNNAVGVSKSTTITINFAAVMDAASVVDALELIPYFQHTIEWNDAGTQIIISPINALTGLTLYNIIIHDTAKGFVNDEHPIEDMSIFFTTIV